MIDKDKCKKLGINIVDSYSKVNNDNNKLLRKLKELLPNLVNSDNQLDIEAIKNVIDILLKC